MSQSTRSLAFVRTRIPTTRFLGTVLLGDLLVLFAFVATGQYAHQYYFWEQPVHTVLITVPFVIAWLLVAPLAGLYSLDRIRSVRVVVPVVIIAWIAVSLLGGAVRATPVFPGGAPVMFLLANIGFGILFLLPWRLLVTWYLKR